MVLYVMCSLSVPFGHGSSFLFISSRIFPRLPCEACTWSAHGFHQILFHPGLPGMWPALQGVLCCAEANKEGTSPILFCHLRPKRLELLTSRFSRVFEQRFGDNHCGVHKLDKTRSHGSW